MPDTDHRAIKEMDEPLNDAADLGRALVMAIAGSDSAGFSEAESCASLLTLANFTQREIARALELWEQAV